MMNPAATRGTTNLALAVILAAVPTASSSVVAEAGPGDDSHRCRDRRSWLRQRRRSALQQADPPRALGRVLSAGGRHLQPRRPGRGKRRPGHDPHNCRFRSAGRRGTRRGAMSLEKAHIETHSITEAAPPLFQYMRVSIFKLTSRITVSLVALGIVSGLSLSSGDALGQGVGNTIGQHSDHAPMSQRMPTAGLRQEKNYNEPLLNKTLGVGRVDEGPQTPAAEREEDRFIMKYVVLSHKHKKIAASGEGLLVSFDYRKSEKTPLPDIIKSKIIDLEKSIF